MKKVIILFVFTLTITSILRAQNEFTKIKLEIGSTLGQTLSNKNFIAGSFYLNPSYFINDKINIGLKLGRYEICENRDGSFYFLNNSSSKYGLLTGRYYFSTNKTRIYSELGVGLINLGVVSAEMADYKYGSYTYGNKLGIMPQIGIDIGHFSMHLSYSYCFGIEAHLPNKNFLSFGIGFFIGGGKK